MIEVAIVGGGPAGAYCAYKLAENGIYAAIFDHSHPREKPCGGMISPSVQEHFPFLKKLPIEHIRINKICLIPPSGRKIGLNLRNGEVICVSRLKFDQFLLNMALERGAKLIREKVLDVEQHMNIWKIKTNKQLYLAKRLVGADGVNSTVRGKIVGPLSKNDKGICCGYFVKGLESKEILFHFLPHRKGYIWIAPRKTEASIGIGCTEIARAKGLRKELDMFIKKNYPDLQITSSWTALIPNIKDVRTLYSRIAGKTWMLIGDAAGHGNSITGEGILYALLGGKLAAQAIVENNTLLYEGLWRETYGQDLFMSIIFRKWIYTGPSIEIYCRYLKFINLCLTLGK